MKNWQRRAFASATAAVAVSGLLYLWMKYWLVSDDPLAVVNHPLQPYVVDAHVLAGPLFLVLFGIVFDAHVSRALRAAAPFRRSGLLSLVTVFAMIASGYLLQVIVADTARQICVVVHIGSGVLFATAYVTHVVSAWRRWRRPWPQPEAAR